MSADTVIRVEGLSKKYLLGQAAPGSGGLRHAMQELVMAPTRWLRRQRESAQAGEFWALQDVSFQVKRGEVVGIIGRNGAGKSTLLKILSRITEPTKGRIGIKGRTASLLEVGTGFHPELTGRENIFLNGAILGMTQAEIRAKFDEIVDFAGVEKFLDTPVKRYSSGMYVRLAFAVAAHLEPEILIVDEVLAVGDSEFQKKCLGKMKEVTKGGRTVLFVSHNLAAVSALCQRGIYLKGGQVVMIDETSRVLDTYQREMAAAPAVQAPHHSRSGSGTHRIMSLDPGASEFPAREPITFRATVKRFRDDGAFHFSLHLRDEWDAEVFSVRSTQLDDCLLSPGDQDIEITIDTPWLTPGDYHVDAYLYSGGIIDFWPHACDIRVNSDVAKHGYTHVVPPDGGRVLPSFQLRIRPQ